MSKHFDAIVIGAGISGLAMAHKLQQAGESVLVLEKASRPGGCFHSEVVPDAAGAFWLEMGTHTCFNSYGRLLELLRELGLMEQLSPREKLRYKLLADGALCSIPSQLRFFELATHAWRLFSLSKEGRSVAEYYGALVGPNNYRDLFRYAFNAVICQQADQVPADMLFRKRPRDKSIMRSYTFPTGLGDIVAALAERLNLRLGVTIDGIHAGMDGYRIACSEGELSCKRLICATPAPAAARLLSKAAPELAEELHWINEVEIESVGVVVEADALDLDAIAGIIAVDGDFYSAVSRDIVAHPQLRGFTFHFKPGLMEDEAKLARICELLGIDRAAVRHHCFKVNRLPAPAGGHHHLTERLDDLLQGHSLALIGNYFAGVAIEDCLERVDIEFARLQQLRC